MADLRLFANTSNLIRFTLKKAADGTPLTGLTGSSTGLIISTIADVEATATAYTAAASHIQTIATLGTYAAPTAGDCRMGEVDPTNHPGLYEFQIADARFAVSNARRLVISVSGYSTLLPTDYEIQLVAFNPYDGVHLGLTSIPNVASGNAGALLVDGTGTAAISNSSGKVLLQATQTGVTIPTVTTVGTLTTYTGNTPQTGDAYAIVNNASYGNAKLTRATVPATTLDTSSVAQTGDNYARLGAPAGASVSADIAAVKSDTGTTLTDAAAIKTKTDFLPSATAGAAGGVMIAGSNAATTFASLTVTTTTTLTGNVSLGGTLGITGAVTLSSTLGVGAVTFNALTVTTTTTLTGAVSLGSTLGITGAVTLSSTLGVGSVTLSSLTVSTTTMFTGAVSLGSTLTVTGTTTLAALTQVGAVTWGATTWASTTITSGGIPANLIESNGTAVYNSDGTLASATASTVTFPALDSAGNSIPDDSRFTYTQLSIVAGTGIGQTVLLTAKSGTRTFNILSGTCPVELDDTSQYVVLGSWQAEVANYVSGQDPATLVLGATAASWDSAGTIGAAINAAGSAGDPWATPEPGSYASGTFGYLVANALDAAISSRSTQTQITGGAYSVQSASCVLGDSRIAHLDADVSSRLAPAGTLAAVTLVTTTTNLTNAPTSGDFTATMKTSLNAATPASIQSVTNIVSGGAITTSGGKVSEVALVDVLTTWTSATPPSGDTYARLGAPAGASVSVDVAAVKASVGSPWQVGTKYAVTLAASDVTGDLPANVIEINGNTTFGGKDIWHTIWYISATTAGLLPSGAGSGTEQWQDFAGTDAVAFTVDADGNRTAAVYS